MSIWIKNVRFSLSGTDYVRGIKMSEYDPYWLKNMIERVKSSKDPSGDRVRELSNTSVPTPFKVEYKALVEDADTCEKTIHQALSRYRVASNREFFDCNAPLAISTIRKLLKIERLRKNN